MWPGLQLCFVSYLMLAGFKVLFSFFVTYPNNPIASIFIALYIAMSLAISTNYFFIINNFTSTENIKCFKLSATIIAVVI